MFTRFSLLRDFVRKLFTFIFQEVLFTRAKIRVPNVLSKKKTLIFLSFYIQELSRGRNTSRKTPMKWAVLLKKGVVLKTEKGFYKKLM